MQAVRLEVVSRVMITTFAHCRQCDFLFKATGLEEKYHQAAMEEYPADVKEEYVQLCNWIRELARRYQGQLFIKLIDVQSPLGLYKSLRYRIRKYPGFIVAGKEVYTGWDKGELQSLLDKHLASATRG
jgi:hypothetical protein